MKKFIYTLALASAFLTTACHDDESGAIFQGNQKEMISFSMTDETGSVAAGLTTRAGFSNATDICMRIRSTKSSSDIRYFVAQATAEQEVSVAITSENPIEYLNYSTVSFKSGFQPYWDDCYGRAANLSVFAVAVPELTSSTTPATKIYTSGTTLAGAGSGAKVGTTDWFTETTENEKISWLVSASQDDDEDNDTYPLKQEDLVYSNNIQPVVTEGKHNGYDGVYRYDFANSKWPAFGLSGGITKIEQLEDGCMKFSLASGAATDAPGKFDKGHLIFNHALSRLTVQINCGTSESGFDMSKNGVFTLSSDGVQFLNMNVKGVLNIEEGTWAHENTKGDITRKPKRQPTIDENNNNAVTAICYNTTAQMLPDYKFVDGEETNVIQFTIDNNTYYVTQDMIFDALNVSANQNADLGYTGAQAEKGEEGQDGYIPAKPGQFKMMQGKNYVLNITVNKKKIENLTATLAPWADVNANMSINNAHVQVSTSSTGAAEDIADHFLFKHEEILNAINTSESTSTSFSGDYKTGGAATLIEMKSSDNSSYTPKQYTTNWYYKDNMTAYHLRMLNKLAADAQNSNSSDAYENITNSGDPSVSSFKMANGEQSKHDYHWGAPMKAKADMAQGKTLLKYEDADGYKASLLNGLIAPTNDNNSAINITELHMMSNINVTLKTTTGSDAINLRTVKTTYADADEYNAAHSTTLTAEAFAALTEEQKAKEYNYAKVKITHVFTAGTVDMGIGKVTPTGTASDQEITAPEDNATNDTHYFKQNSGADVKTETMPFSWAVVPQKLTRPENNKTVYVGITITTPDNNEYYVVEKLATIKPESVGSQQGQQHTQNDAITQWYPNHTYNYTFTLSKKGIEAITCTLADWVTVNGKDTNITLED